MRRVDDRDVRDDVGELLVRYASGLDRHDWELLRSCFTDDCDADYGEVGAWRGADELVEWMRQMHEPLGPTLHRITNVDVSIDGDRVSSRCYVDAVVMFGDGPEGVQAIGFYDDELEQADGRWRIARRRFTQVSVRTFGASET